MPDTQPFQLRYENTIEDAVALTKFYYRNAPVLQRRRRNTYIVLLLWMLICNYFIYGSTSILMMLLSTLVCCAVTLGLVAGIRLLLGDRLIRRQYAGDKNRGFLGPHEVELSDDGLVYRTTYQEGKLAWGMIERIESTKDHTFIFLGTANAMIIPHARITGGDYHVFLSELGRRYKPDQPLLRSEIV